MKKWERICLCELPGGYRFKRRVRGWEMEKSDLGGPNDSIYLCMS